MNNRDVEEKEGDLCKDPKAFNVDSKLIAELITEYVSNQKPVYLVTDLHLWVKDNDDPTKVTKRSNFNQVISNWNNTVEPNDLVICLGDLVDGEFPSTDSKMLRNTLSLLSGNKILVRGNNDLFSYTFYRSCGFKYVIRKFEWNNIVFSHYPIENDNDLNIHGHLHGYKRYYIQYSNQIDVFNKERKPQLLLDVIKQQPEYSKSITVVTDKLIHESMFIGIMENYKVKQEYMAM